MSDILNVLEFIFITPFSQNWVFPFFILVFFGINFSLNFLKNIKRFSQYKKNMDTLMLEDYEEGITSSNVSGILMSIGIIGTFFLIYDSLSQLNKSDSISMMTMISNEIAPAFSISALGITASIIYVLLEQLLILGSYKARISLFKYNNQDNLNTYSNTISNDRKLNQEILMAIQEQTRTFASLNSFSDGMVEMNQSMNKFRTIADTLEKTLNPEVLGEVISKALLKDLRPVLESIHIITGNVNTNSEKLTKFLEEDLTKKVITPLVESVKSTDESMKEMKIVLKDTSEVMQKTSEGIGKISENLNKLEELQIDFVKNLDETTKKITGTYSLLNGVISKQIDKFNENSETITNSFTKLSTDMQTFLVTYKKDYQKMLKDTGEKSSELITKASEALQTNLKDVNSTLIKTGEEASKTITEAGRAASDLITNASVTLQGTLDGVDDALVETSKNITKELDRFKNSYTDTLKEFLDSQEKILDEVFKKQTERLSSVVTDFRVTLEKDVSDRKILNKDLEKLVKTTNGFVTSTQTMITTAFDVQKVQLVEFMKNNQSMQGELKNMIDDVRIINANGNELTKDLIETTANLQKQFYDGQKEVLEKYQLEVDTNLEETMDGISDIAKGMLEVVELIHQTKEESEK